LPDDVRAALAERMGVNARLLDGFELREGPHGPVPFCCVNFLHNPMS
jgi:hypothetical protein